MSTSRLIKKYPNRRLYDTRTSSYITLADVKQLVLDHEAFRVVDAKTEADLTRSILLQIILEEESGGTPLFSEQMLAQTIGFYGHPLQSMMNGYLEKAVGAFIEIQDTMQDQSRDSYKAEGGSVPSPEMWSQFLSMQTPMIQTMMTSYIDQSKRLFEQMQEQVELNTRNMFDGLQLNPRPEDKDK